MKLRIMTERLLAWMASDEEAYLRDRIVRLRIGHGKKDWRGNVTDNSHKIKQHEDCLKGLQKRNQIKKPI